MASTVTRLPIIRNKNYKFNGFKSYVSALTKYGITPTQSGSLYRNDKSTLMKMQGDATQGTTVTADDNDTDSFYTVPVQIGTPAQTVNLDFDSGSSDLWVWSTLLDKATLATGQTNKVVVFDSTKSSTFKNVSGSTWKISYGDGSGASGNVGTDNVTIGDITIQNQTVELASQLSSQFEQGTSSGLLGLAFGKLNTVTPQAATTPVDNMIAQKDIPTSAELWSVYLGTVKDVNDADHGESFYTFGNYDQTVVTASGQDIAWAPVDNSQGFWTVDSTSASINGKSIALSGNTAIADTGTTLMLVSDQFVTALYESIKGATFEKQDSLWIIPKANIDSRPVVQVAFGDAMITIEKEQLGWQDYNDTMSIGGIQSRGDSTFDIFGDVFLINVYAIFDVGNTRLGVVQRATPTPAST